MSEAEASKDDGPEMEKPLEKGGENDCSNGPVKNRGCTDIFCTALFAVHWVVFIIIMGICMGGDGDPVRLTAMRDWKGGFCGSKGNFNPWNADENGPGWDLTGKEQQFYAMNVQAMFQFLGVGGKICSPTIKAAYDAANSPPATENAAALCAGVGNDDPTAKMQKLASGDVSMLMEGDPSMLSQMSTFFTPSCVTSCTDVSNFAIGAKATAGTNQTMASARTYNYYPPPNVGWYKIMHWLYTTGGSTLDAIPGLRDMLSFQALPASICPDAPQYCIPFPGLKQMAVADLCVFDFGTSGLSAAAGAAADALSKSAGAIAPDFGSMMGDIQIAAWSFVIVGILSLVIGFVFMILLRFFVGYIVWSAILSVLVLLCAGGGYFYAQTICEEKTLTAPVTNSTTGLATGAVTTSTVEDCEEPDESVRDQNKVYAYIFLILAGIYAFFICCMFTRIKLGIAVNKVAAKFVYQTKGIILLPPIQAVVALLWALWWLVVAMYVLSRIDNTDTSKSGPYDYIGANGTNDCKYWDLGCTDTPGACNDSWPTGDSFFDESIAYDITDWNTGARSDIKNGATCVPGGAQKCYRCSMPRYSFDTTFAYVFFSLLWNNALIVAIGQCTIAGAVAAWYFTPNDQKGYNAAIMPAVYNCFRFHFGSLAFGAFILAVVQFIKYALEYVKRNAQAQKNYILQKIAALLQCIVRCFERFVKFLNKNAYIQIAILGKNFCRSAWAAFCLILRNAARLGVLAMIGTLVRAIGIMFIVATTTIIGYFILIAMYEEDISSPVLCILLFFMMGYVIGQLFMDVFGLAVDTTLQCFVADEELHAGGEAGGAQYTPEELKGFLKDPNSGSKLCCCK
ncbi:unnamed protein product [Amoebophrya sp. A25]|nr:unnamed protein product [Amoebophrya sp. A25]|eukprot:GSA25T00021869001.1